MGGGGLSRPPLTQAFSNALINFKSSTSSSLALTRNRCLVWRGGQKVGGGGGWKSEKLLTETQMRISRKGGGERVVGDDQKTECFKRITDTFPPPPPPRPPQQVKRMTVQFHTLLNVRQTLLQNNLRRRWRTHLRRGRKRDAAEHVLWTTPWEKHNGLFMRHVWMCIMTCVWVWLCVLLGGWGEAFVT